jgi:hypothetical protein
VTPFSVEVISWPDYLTCLVDFQWAIALCTTQPRLVESSLATFFAPNRSIVQVVQYHITNGTKAGTEVVRDRLEDISRIILNNFQCLGFQEDMTAVPVYFGSYFGVLNFTPHPIGHIYTQWRKSHAPTHLFDLSKFFIQSSPLINRNLAACLATCLHFCEFLISNHKRKISSYCFGFFFLMYFYFFFFVPTKKFFKIKRNHNLPIA